MVFSSSTFIFLFLPIVIIGYFLIERFIPVFRNVFLLLVSLGFYWFGEPRFVLILIVSVLLNWAIALMIDRNGNKGIRKVLLISDIVLNLSVLIIFKYTNFITYNMSRLWADISVTNIALPVGISFFTFQAMSYVVDVYRGEKSQSNPINIGLYISFFPQLIAGPIVRYKTITKEIRDRKVNWQEITEGIVIFLKGLFKKMIMANNLAIVADAAFAGDVAAHSVLFSWLGGLAYTLQIYFDFSGYSDMAIGLGRVFGFHFSQNFDHPYAASSITDFWRRWHISLSSWFRDYVYIPLGGSRCSQNKQIRNLFVVWLLTGIWHGADWTFVLWGMAYFILLSMEKFVIHPEKIVSKLVAALYRVFVFVAVILCWVMFRAGSMQVAFSYYMAMFGLKGNPIIDDNWIWYAREYVVYIILGLMLSTMVFSAVIRKTRKKIPELLYEPVRAGIYMFLFVVCISYLVTGAHNPFIYFNF